MSKLDRLAELLNQMTPGSWYYSSIYGVVTIEVGRNGEAVAHCVEYLTPNNADGICELRNLAPSMLKALRAANELEEAIGGRNNANSPKEWQSHQKDVDSALEAYRAARAELEKV